MVITQAEIEIESLPVRRYEDAAGPVAVRRVSWGAVFAGVAIGWMTHLWLSMLGVAIGASTIDPLREANPLSGLGVGGAVWMSMSLILSAFVGGWITSRLAGIPRRVEAALHGALSWAASNILALLLLGSLFGAVLGGVSRLAGGAAQTAAQADGPGIVESARDLIDRVQPAAQSAVQSGQAQQQARVAGEQAATAVAGTSWGLVAIMFLALCAAIGGALLGAPIYPSNRPRQS
jgi:hypothetical protein